MSVTNNMHHEFLEKITIVFVSMGCNFRIIDSVIFHFNAILSDAFHWDNWKKTCLENFCPRIRHTKNNGSRLDMWKSGIHCIVEPVGNIVFLSVDISSYKQKRCDVIHLNQIFLTTRIGKSLDDIFRSIRILRFYGKYNISFWRKIIDMYDPTRTIDRRHITVNDNLFISLTIGRLDITIYGTFEHYYYFNPFDPDVSTLFSFIQENIRSETNTKKDDFQLYSICKQSKKLHGKYSREYRRLLN